MAAGMLLVDASPKFLRLALEKFRGDQRIGLRYLRYLKEEGRLQGLEDALDHALLARGVEAIFSTNALHLYHDLVETLASFRRMLVPEGRVFI